VPVQSNADQPVALLALGSGNAFDIMLRLVDGVCGGSVIRIVPQAPGRFVFDDEPIVRRVRPTSDERAFLLDDERDIELSGPRLNGKGESSSEACFDSLAASRISRVIPGTSLLICVRIFSTRLAVAGVAAGIADSRRWFQVARAGPLMIAHSAKAETTTLRLPRGSRALRIS